MADKMHDATPRRQKAGAGWLEKKSSENVRLEMLLAFFLLQNPYVLNVFSS